MDKQVTPRTFNEQIEATAFAGEVRADLTTIKVEVREVRVDVKAMLSRQDKFLGVIAVGAFAVPLVIRILWP